MATPRSIAMTATGVSRSGNVCTGAGVVGRFEIWQHEAPLTFALDCSVAWCIIAIMGQSLPQCIDFFRSAWHGIAAIAVPVAMTKRSTRAANLNVAFIPAYID